MFDIDEIVDDGDKDSMRTTNGAETRMYVFGVYVNRHDRIAKCDAKTHSSDARGFRGDDGQLDDNNELSKVYTSNRLLDHKWNNKVYAGVYLSALNLRHHMFIAFL